MKNFILLTDGNDGSESVFNVSLIAGVIELGPESTKNKSAILGVGGLISHVSELAFNIVQQLRIGGEVFIALTERDYKTPVYMNMSRVFSAHSDGEKDAMGNFKNTGIIMSPAGFGLDSNKAIVAAKCMDILEPLDVVMKKWCDAVDKSTN